jgi:hypothetical protein
MEDLRKAALPERRSASSSFAIKKCKNDIRIRSIS